jgi:hypothetical protein
VWNEYFVHKDAHISFVEKDRTCAEKWRGNITRGNLYIGAQEDPEVLQEIVSKNEGPGFDIIIDDGGHTMKQQQDSFRVLWPLVRPGGLYFIEDLETSYEGYLEKYASAGYITTAESIKLLFDKMVMCGFYGHECPDYVRMECSRNICVFQKAF